MTLAFRSLQVFGRHLAWFLVLIVFLLVPSYAAYGAFSNVLAIGAVAAAGTLLFLITPGLAAKYVPSRFGEASARRPLLFLILCVGIGARILASLLIDPVQTSDPQDYLAAAARWVDGEGYYFEIEGYRLLAWRPPGMSMVYAGLYRVFGNAAWLPVAVNTIAYALAALAAYGIARRLISREAALVGVGVLSLWPAHILVVGTAYAEQLSMALYTVAAYGFVRALDSRWGEMLGCAILAGLCTGVGALFRPALMAFFTAWIAVGILWANVRSAWTARLFIFPLVAIVATVAAISPWTVRNAEVLDAFVPISTNGGDVFYRANNPLATGDYTNFGEIDLNQYLDDELNWNKQAMHHGLEWVKENPVDFGILAFKKQSLLMGGGAYSRHVAGSKGNGFDYEWMIPFEHIGNVLWYGLALLTLTGLVRHRAFFSETPQGTALMMFILFTITVHSVFESQARHHTPILPLVIICALFALWRPRNAPVSEH